MDSSILPIVSSIPPSYLILLAIKLVYLSKWPFVLALEPLIARRNQLYLEVAIMLVVDN